MQRFSKKTLLAVLITFIITFVVSGLFHSFLFNSRALEFERLNRIMQIIDEQYVGEYDVKDCEDAAINAVLGSLNDKYAVYYDEKNAEETMQNIEGYYYGIGVEVFANTQKNCIEILAVYADAPAAKAGMLPGDIIVSLDKKNYGADELADLVTYIKGDGSEASLKQTLSFVIERSGEKKEYSLSRAKLGLYQVTSEITDNICYIKYPGFSKKSLSDFKKIINELDEKKIKGIVVDIRDNPGGEFKSVIGMCDIFLDDEQIMYTLDKKGNKTVYTATKGKNNLPLAVIVSNSSASASEVFAGAIQANKRGVIIGEPTFGKGVTQSVMYLDGYDKAKGALKITTYKNYTPEGRWINEKILPDIEVKIEKPGKDIREDAAFKAAAEYFNKEKK